MQITAKLNVNIFEEIDVRDNNDKMSMKYRKRSAKNGMDVLGGSATVIARFLRTRDG